MEPSREEHLKWCKQRALEYCAMGDVNQAYASFGSDMGKHPETANHPALIIGIYMLMSESGCSVNAMQRFIEGFH